MPEVTMYWLRRGRPGTRALAGPTSANSGAFTRVLCLALSLAGAMVANAALANEAAGRQDRNSMYVRPGFVALFRNAVPIAPAPGASSDLAPVADYYLVRSGYRWRSGFGVAASIGGHPPRLRPEEQPDGYVIDGGLGLLLPPVTIAGGLSLQWDPLRVGVFCRSQRTTRTDIDGSGVAIVESQSSDSWGSYLQTRIALELAVGDPGPDDGVLVVGLAVQGSLGFVEFSSEHAVFWNGIPQTRQPSPKTGQLVLWSSLDGRDLDLAGLLAALSVEYRFGGTP